MNKVFLVLFLFLGTLAFSQVPTATISLNTPTVCTGNTVIFSSSTSNTPTAFSWVIYPESNLFIAPGTSQPSMAVSFSKAGVYSVSLTVSNTSGSTTAVQTILVNQSPSARFSASLTNTGYPSQLHLTNFSTNAHTYSWNYSETTLNDITLNATHDYTASGSYSVSLIAYNNNGCSDTSRYSFFINDSSGVMLPNIFTPNGDGINDVFKPIAAGLSSIKADIYSRYGNYIYGWDTINGFWDGHTTSGEACQSGVYFCVLEAAGFDGKTYKLKGYITLLR